MKFYIPQQNLSPQTQDFYNRLIESSSNSKELTPLSSEEQNQAIINLEKAKEANIKLTPPPNYNYKKSQLILKEYYTQATQYCSDYHFNSEFQKFKCIKNFITDNCQNCTYEFSRIIQNCRNTTTDDATFSACVKRVINKHTQTQISTTLPINNDQHTYIMGLSLMFFFLLILGILVIRGRF